MNERCDRCGKIARLCYHWHYDRAGHDYQLDFCFECGETLDATIKTQEVSECV